MFVNEVSQTLLPLSHKHHPFKTDGGTKILTVTSLGFVMIFLYPSLLVRNPHADTQILANDVPHKHGAQQVLQFSLSRLYTRNFDPTMSLFSSTR